MSDLPEFPTISALLDAYRTQQLDPVQVMLGITTRMESGDSRVWLSTIPKEHLMERATALLHALRSDPEAAFRRYPLLGIPFAVKDKIDVADLPTTAACPAMQLLPGHSARVVSQLLAAGAILVGKTNMDQFATGLVGTRSPMGTPANPFDRQRIPGGSSSGSAVACASGLVAFALGTDTAGSGRVPAGLCNLVGLKPTPGLVDTDGVFPACKSLDCISVFAHTVADAWLVLQQTMVDSSHAWSQIYPLGPVAVPVRVGVLAERDRSMDDMAWEAYVASISALEQAGLIDPVFTDMTDFYRVADLLYDGPWMAERQLAFGAWMARFPEAMDPAVASVMKSAGQYSAMDLFAAEYQLADLAERCWHRFHDFDVLLLPTTPLFPTLAEVAAEPLALNARLGRFTNFVNLLGMCALSMPGLFRKDELPAGVTWIGLAGADQRLAELARQAEPVIHLRLGTGRSAPPRSRQELNPLPASEPLVKVAVAGAHLSGFPLNKQLTQRCAQYVSTRLTAPMYRLFKLTDTKPGLVQVPEGGSRISVEIWEMPVRLFGDFVMEIPAPLGIGKLRLDDGQQVCGFLCESSAVVSAEDITASGGWRAYNAERV